VAIDYGLHLVLSFFHIFFGQFPRIMHAAGKGQGLVMAQLISCGFC
jgi:hypothetical protein